MELDNEGKGIQLLVEKNDGENGSEGELEPYVEKILGFEEKNSKCCDSDDVERVRPSFDQRPHQVNSSHDGGPDDRGFGFGQ